MNRFLNETGTNLNNSIDFMYFYYSIYSKLVQLLKPTVSPDYKQQCCTFD